MREVNYKSEIKNLLSDGGKYFFQIDEKLMHSLKDYYDFTDFFTTLQDMLSEKEVIKRGNMYFLPVKGEGD